MVADVINRIKQDLNNNFLIVDNWFNCNNVLLDYIPQNGGWTVRQILEHIYLTNFFLLILIKKGTVKAIEKARKQELVDIPFDYDLNLTNLSMIGEHKSFVWTRPSHMEPKGEISTGEIRILLNVQLQESLNCLDQMPNGEGVLHKTMMTVNNLGKIDLYHYIYFLSQHIKRHIKQMEGIKAEMEGNIKNILNKNGVY